MWKTWEFSIKLWRNSKYTKTMWLLYLPQIYTKQKCVKNINGGKKPRTKAQKDSQVFFKRPKEIQLGRQWTWPMLPTVELYRNQISKDFNKTHKDNSKWPQNSYISDLPSTGLSSKQPNALERSLEMEGIIKVGCGSVAPPPPVFVISGKANSTDAHTHTTMNTNNLKCASCHMD